MAEAASARARIESADRLVPIQFGILYGCLADASNSVYLGQWCGLVDGPLDLAVLERAWRDLIARHSILRTAFDWQLKAEPLQIVLSAVAAEIGVSEIATDVADPLGHPQIRAFLAEDRARGFDLTRPPLMRLSALRLAADRHVLVWTRHHLTCDGWSLPVVFGELFDLYAALKTGQSPNLPPASPYAAYVAWWHNQDGAAATRFWAERLARHFAAAPEPIAPTAAEIPEFRERVRVLAPERLAELRAACRASRVTLNTLVQGAWALTLARHGESDEVLFGATEAIRPEDADDGGVCLGPQINTLPVAISAWDDLPVGDWLRGIQAMGVAGRRHGRVSLSDIAAACGLAQGRALFDSVLVFQNYPMAAATLPEATGLRLGRADDVASSDLPLNLIVEPGEGLVCRLIYDSSRTGDDAAEALLRTLTGAAEALASAAAGSQPLRSVDIRPDLAPAPASVSTPSPLTLLHQIAAVPDDACALVHGETRLSFGELVGRAQRAANSLVRRFGRGRRIGLLCASTVDSIVALLAIQWSGGAYVPLDPALPPARLAGMIEDAALTAIVTDPATNPGALAEAAVGIPVVPFSLVEPTVDGGPPPDFPPPDAPAYIIFTSGSTGRPKGVAVPHRALYASVNARLAVYPEPVEAALVSFPLIFDGSVLILFSTLARGATVVLPDPSPVQDAVSLCRTIARVGVTHTVMIPSLFAAVLDSASPDQLHTLRACAVAGEACEPQLVRRHYASLPTAALVNEYGPTEATVWASAYRCPAVEEAAPVPIGRAVDGTHIYLLDRHLRPVAPGLPGELYIGGGHVAWGYVGNPAMTAERFLPDPWSAGPGARMYRTGDLGVARADGEIVFLGRADQQVKLRGYRIETGEIEAVLAAEPGVAEAVVLFVVVPVPRLVAYVTARPGAVLDAAGLRRAAAARLPDYMVPTIMVLPTLPRLTSGKVDRRALPLPDLEADGHDDEPPTEQEAPLAALWGEVLGRGPVPVTRDFFELGGTSLLGMRLVAQIRARLAAPIELYHLFRHPTVRALAPVVAEAGDGALSGAAPIVRRDRRRGTAAPMSDA